MTLLLVRAARASLSLLPLLLLLFAVFGCRRVAAWDTDGHQAIGMTAMSSLTGKAATQVKRLMGGKDVVDVAGWAHRVETKHPETAPLHFQFQTMKWSCKQLQTDQMNCPNNQCLVRAIQHFYTRLIGRPDLVPLAYPDGLRFTDGDAVRFLTNLIGDLHQPLHLGFQDDQGGQLISFKVHAAGGTDTVSMFDYWDSHLIQRFIAERPATWFGGWTHAHSLGSSKLAELKKEWDSEPSETRHVVFERWAAESLQKACAEMYKDRKLGTAILDGFEVSPAFDYQAMDLVKNQILVGGVRIALVLNSILTERDAGKLRQGSAVDVEALEVAATPGGRSGRKATVYLKGFAINAAIILVVVLVFWYGVTFYFGGGGAARAAAALTPSGRRLPVASSSVKDATKRF